MKNFFTLLTALSLCLLPTTAWSQSNCVPVPASYSVTDVGTLGGDSSIANALNDSGSVAGYGPTTGDAATDPFLWTPSNGIQDLGSLGGPLGVAWGINSAGYVVGYSTLANYIPHAFLWTPSGGIQDLGTLGGSIGFSAAFGIDDRNRIVGNTYTQTNEDGGDAAIWVGSKLYDLGTNGGFAAQFNAVNSKLELAGYSRNFNPGTNAFFWTKTGGFKNLPSLFTGDGSQAFALNNHGWIVGDDYTPTPRVFYAVLWIRGAANNLGSLGGGSAAASGVNDQCQVVGNSLLSDSVTYNAFIWTQAGGMQDLNNLIAANSGWTLQSAAAINASGQIAGTGLINGLTHAFLLTPTP